MEATFINVQFEDSAKKDLKLFADEISRTIETSLIDYLKNSKRQQVPKRFFPIFICEYFQIWKYKAKAVKHKNIPEWRCLAVFVESENFFYVHVLYPRKEYDKSTFKNRISQREDELKKFYQEKTCITSR